MKVEIQFSPYLTEESIQEEALQLAIRRAVDEDKAKDEDEYIAKGESKQRSGKRRKSLAAPAGVPPLVSTVASLEPTVVGSHSDHSDLRGMHPPEHG